jgi:threonine/homoserine/homoserine lactone efflux protein
VLLALLAFSGAAFLIVLLPGPDTLVVVRSLLRYGRGSAIRSVAGVLSGLARPVPAEGTDSAEPTEAAGTTKRRRAGVLGGGYPAGLASDLLNPKVGVFFVAFLPGFVPHGYDVGLVTILLGAIFIAETALYFAVLLTASKSVTRWLRNPRIQRRIDRVTGVVLVGFGARLALEN